MLRLARLPPRIRPVQPNCRSLVSSALLSRAWQNESIAELRSEAKLRGLSAKGSKAALASRIEDYEKNLAFPGSRNASTTQATPTTSPPPSIIPGNPELPPTSHKAVFDVKIPNLSQPAVQEAVQVPYLPDFWQSSAPSIDPVSEEPQPKLLVVAGVDTHHGGGPSHNLLDLGSGSSKIASATEKAIEILRTDSLLDDILQDLHLPLAKGIKESLQRIF
ncbi:hypothetical protein GALMADRAFT_239727 [Galerina marginata CBS 339.88]|uniref:SAP domain-containing protein n=1 Tax=Galerina marginata (strain CBS 339.88) TaxID=685588 RepID=A0A067TER4_GALM3|nr:hypothetical protein GALMADRAFT_239727 [Galerina marginata CBS 339.88]